MKLSPMFLSRLSRTNNPPTVDQAIFIREAIQDMERKMAENQQQSQKLVRKLDEYRSILAPCRRLPLEILGEIFIQLLDRLASDTYANQTILVQVSRVCKSWRHAAYLLPQLWSTAAINLDRIMMNRRSWYDSVKTWLMRSGKTPKRIWLYSRSRTCSMKPLHVNDDRMYCTGHRCDLSSVDVLNMLKFGPPIDDLTINPGTPHCWNNLVSKLQRAETDQSFALDSITSLAVHADDWYYWVDISRHPLIPFATALKQFSLLLPDFSFTSWSEERPSMDSVDFGLPPNLLNNLTEIEIKCNWPANHIFNMLQHCHNLETLYLDLYNGYFGDWNRSNPLMLRLAREGICFPKLRSLCLYEFPLDGHEDLRLIQLPCIVDVTIVTIDRYLDDEDEDDMTIDDICGSSIANFLRGGESSDSTLQSLTIQNGDFDGGALVDILQGLSSLEHLTLRCTNFNANTFSKIAAAKMLPRLRTLQILCHHVQLADVVGLEEFVEERGIELTTS
ncbi:hypothetical protein NMY22_g1631 [Coprinellus aureogranulatus]|nr:hypothetical protein NMY22_g1631 [Coprinellus aureogranulatus]